MIAATRFWVKVHRSPDCWRWMGSKCGNGYGQFFFERRLQVAHRVAWELSIGPIPAGLWVLHRCDVRHCVRPDHLFLGDRKRNTDDMLAKGRSVRGEHNGQAKLTTAQVLEIRRLRKLGWRQQRIASLFGIGQGNVSAIVSGKRWRHVQAADAVLYLHDGQVEVRG